MVLKQTSTRCFCVKQIVNVSLLHSAAVCHTFETLSYPDYSSSSCRASNTVRLIHQQSTAEQRYLSRVDDDYNKAKLSDVDDTYYYGVGCSSCLRHARISLVRARESLGADLPLADLLKRLKCSTCGNKKVTVGFSSHRKRSAIFGRYFEKRPYR